MKKCLSIVLSAAIVLGVFAVSYAGTPLRKDNASGNRNLISLRGIDKKSHAATRGRPSVKEPVSGGIRREKSEIRSATAPGCRKASPEHALASTVNLVGTMVYAGSWESSNYGLYTIPASGTGFERLASFHQNYNYGAIDNGEGRFYGVNYTDFMGYWDYVSFDVYDTSDWSLISSGEGHYDVMSQGVALDPTTGDIYGVFNSADGKSWNWAKADYENGTSIPIAPCDVYFMSIGVDETGQYYGVGTDKVLYKIDKATGDLTSVGNVDVPYADYFQGGCVNTKNGTYIQSYCTDEESGLIEIDLATGASTLLVKFPDHNEFVGLHIAKSIAEDKAPAAPELHVTCENGSMDVEIELTMPVTHFDGTPATGETFSYSVLANGESVLEGTALSGSMVNETVTIDETGIASFVATVSNEAGPSPKAKASCFVGKGAPKAPGGVMLTWADDVATLTWDAVTESADGGYLNPADVTYTVFSAEGEEIATVSDPIYTTSVPASTGGIISYSVNANYGGKSSEAIASNAVLVGELTAPFTMDLTEEDNFSIHSILDANGDGKTWRYNFGACYNYDSDNAGDDWLFSPAIRLEAGKAYRISAMVREHHNSYVERIEIFVGQGATPEAMTRQLVPVTDIVSTEPVELGDYFIPETSGLYNIGFHAVSEANEWYMYVPSYSVSAPVDGSMPAVVDNPSVTPDAEGYLKAVISFKAPSVNIAGGVLTGDMTVKVLRNGIAVGETRVAAGNEASVEDNGIPEAGTYTYTIVSCSNDGTEGVYTTVSTFIGPKVPQAVDSESVSLVETEPGTFLFSWDPVTTATDGSPIKPENISYKVYTTAETEGSLTIGDEIATVSETEFSYTPDPVDIQKMLYLCVRPFNLTAGAESASVGMAVAGPAYDMPVGYSNTQDIKDYFLVYGGDGKLKIFNSESIPGIYAQDHDNEYFVVEHTGLDQSTRFTTGKIKITGDNPVLSFYVFCLTGMGETDDVNTTNVSVVTNGEEIPLADVDNSCLQHGRWNKVKVSLAEYAGKNIQIRLAATCKGYAYNLYDNIRIYDEPMRDVAAEIRVPEKVETGVAFDVTVNISNEGAEPAGAVTVDLYRDGEITDSRSLENDINTDCTETVTFSQTLGLFDGENRSYRAVVNFEGDENPDNNGTPAVTVARRLSRLPGVTGFTGEVTEEGHLLSWDIIETGDRQSLEIDESFESGEPFAGEFDGWTFVDADQSPVGGFEGVKIPGFSTGVTHASFFVFDSTTEGFNESFAARTGDKYLAALYRYDNGQTDDWAISPRLPGIAQTVTFHARSYSATDPENIEVWYSTSGKDLESFVKIESFGTQSPAEEWTEYSFDIPEGAVYFAIRSCATASFMLLVDDVTFIGLDGIDAEIAGYNLYCNGARLNESPISENSYIYLPDEGDYTYHATAVYDMGESELSDPVLLHQSSTDGFKADSMKITVNGHMIIVSGTAGAPVSVSTSDGIVVESCIGDTSVTVDTGIYLVTVGTETSKVYVR